MKKALISGITGMVGSHLAEFLLEKDYRVFGIVRRSSVNNTGRIAHLLGHIILLSGDLADQSSLDGVVDEVQPDEIYHLGGLSHVQISWAQPELTADITGVGTLRMLEAVRKYKPDAKFYFAASSEMFGKVETIPQNEFTRFYPRSPYAAAKVFGFEITRVYRESFGMFACSGICMNHESVRRGEDFVTKKIARGVAKIARGLQDHIELGNLDAQRDWSHAKDIVKGMWLILQYPHAEDWILASGETHSVREFCELAFSIAGIKDWEQYVRINEAFFRPAEVDLLLGNPTKAEILLGWTREYNFEDIVADLVTFELAQLL